MEALKAVFGYGDEVTTETIKFIPGTYRWADLYTWYGEVTQLTSPHLVSFDMGEVTNRLVVGVDDLSVVPALRAQLDGSGVPEEAVVFEETELPIVDLKGIASLMSSPVSRGR